LHPIFRMRALLILCFSMMLVACGFHLRGVQSLPEALRNVYVQADANNKELAHIVRHTLRANNVYIAADKEQAQAILFLENNRLNNQLTSLVGSAQAGHYMITQEVTMSIQDPEGKYLLHDVKLSVTRNYSSNATQVLSANDTIKSLKDHMLQDLSTEILQRIAAIDIPSS